MSDYEYITKRSSNNYTPAAKVPRVYGMARKITGITIHHWGVRGQRFDNVVTFLCRPGGMTSAHYVVEAGRIACIVDPKDAAWHAGNGRGNATTVGIECRPEASAGDYETVAQLIRELRATYGNLPLYPHKHWKNTACPGAWDLDKLDRLARSGAAPKPAKSHTVKRGETLWGIARANGSTVAALQKKNNIRDADALSVGQIIKL